MPRIVALKKARELGLARYYTGIPCVNGHVSERRTSDKRCLECARIKSRAACGSEHMKEYGRRYRERNREKIKAQQRRWRIANRDKERQRLARHRRAKRDDRTHKCMVMMHDLKKRAVNHIKGAGKTAKFQELGYSSEELKIHIEKQFSGGMSWDNHGDWHVDHIVSVAEMVRHGVTDPSVINCLSNLRPLWAKQNRQKSCKSLYLI